MANSTKGLTARLKLYDELIALRRTYGPPARLSDTAKRERIEMLALKRLRAELDRELLEMPAASDWIS